MKKRNEHLNCLSAISAVLLGLAGFNVIAESSSTNYRIPWEVVDSGGGESQSTSYRLNGSLAQAVQQGESMSGNYILLSGFFAPPDTDLDQVRDFLDNCINDANTDQRNSNAGTDGFGNICDPDLNNDGRIDFADLAMLKAVFFTADADADLNGDNRVDFADLARMKARFFGQPGPSALEP